LIGDPVKAPLLFLHGSLSTATHFGPLVDFLAREGYSCSAPTLPGHDPPDRRALADLSIPDYVAFARAALAGLGGRPVVIGHSMGGLLGQLIAAEGACAGLVLLSSVPPGPLPPQPRILPYLAPYMPEILAGLPFRFSDYFVSQVVVPDVPQPERDLVVPTFVPESGRAYRAMLFGTHRLPPGAVRCPVLCISGDDDRVVAPAILARIAERYGAEHLVLPGRGHWTIGRHLVATVGQRIAEWLQRFDGAAAPAGGPLPA
jgi:pimeloyl-ACP methyl ester carboxylesterase